MDILKNKGRDQDIINKHLLHNNELSVCVFDKEKIVCGWDFNQSYKDTYLIYKSFIHHEANINKNYNNRLKIFYNAGLIDKKEYDDNIKNTLIENYKFDWETYVNNYPDLQKANINTEEKALWHWNKFGQKESRTFIKII